MRKRELEHDGDNNGAGSGMLKPKSMTIFSSHYLSFSFPDISAHFPQYFIIKNCRHTGKLKAFLFTYSRKKPVSWKLFYSEHLYNHYLDYSLSFTFCYTCLIYLARSVLLSILLSILLFLHQFLFNHLKTPHCVNKENKQKMRSLFRVILSTRTIKDFQ